VNPAERTAKIAELRAEADRLEREGKRNWPEDIKSGMLFRHPSGAVYVSAFPGGDGRLTLVQINSDDKNLKNGTCSGLDGFGFRGDSVYSYLGYARDLLAIKMPDAPEPTGAELVGKVCEFSMDGKVWVAIGRCDKYCGPDAREPFCFFCDQGGLRYGWWPHARLYREDRP